MNKYDQVLKKCTLIFCSGCIIFSLVLLAQIQEQKRQIQILQYLKTETGWLLMRSETESAKTETQLKKEIIQKSQELTNKRELIWAYKKDRQEMKEQEERILALRTYYEKGVYLDLLAAELDRENESNTGIERYFKIEKGELEDILGEMVVADRLKADFPDADQWGYLVPAGDGIWVQYDADASQDALPTGVVVQNPLSEIGYKDARAGMYLYDIESRYPESAVEEAELEQGKIRYLRYTDEEFIYYYVAVSDLGDAVIAYIVPNNGYILRGIGNEE